MKRLCTLILVIVFSISFFLAAIEIYNKILDNKIESNYKESVAKVYGSPEKNGGSILQKKGIENNNFMLYGSSELGSKVPQNPVNFFPTQKDNIIVNVVGRGYVQDLEHTINLGALGKELKDKKVGFVVSIQWFMDKDGISADRFQMNFSELQYYKFMNNNNISRESKEYVSNRVIQLTKGNEEFKYARMYAKLYTSDSFEGNIGYYLFKPYFFIRERMVNTRDKIKTLKFLKSKYSKVSSNKNKSNGDWKNETEIAELMGKKAVTNNSYYVEDNYYNEYLKDKLDLLKDTDKNVDLDKSIENKDYKELLEVCKKLNIKPYFIIMPVNGYFYDYRGLSKESREKYYSKMESMANNYGFNALNMTNKDYEPYFMIDIMHLGWKGWLYVDEKIAEYKNSN